MFKENAISKHLIQGDVLALSNLQQLYATGKFGRREYLEFLMGVGVGFQELSLMKEFQMLEFISPPRM
jgi:hypothetical protein